MMWGNFMSSGSLEGYVNVTKERRDGLVYTFAPVFEHCIEWNITNSCFFTLYNIYLAQSHFQPHLRENPHLTHQPLSKHSR
jgi:hypothetical protein